MSGTRPAPPPKASLIKRFLWYCSGSTIQVLKGNECVTDHNKHAAIGSTVFLTAVLAAITGGYAVFISFSSYIAAILLGIFWGILIFNFDRSIVLSVKKEKGKFLRQLGPGVFRLVLAILLSLVITTPLELKIFEKEIGDNLKSSDQETLNQEIKKIDERYGEISKLKDRNSTLETEIKTKEGQVNTAQQQYDTQLERTRGTNTFVLRGRVYNTETAGDRRLRQSREATVNRLIRESSALNTKNTAEINKNKEEIKTLEASRNTEIDNRRTEIETSHGLADRIDAMRAVMREKKTAAIAFYLILTVFIIIETAPVMVKWMSKYGPYDAVIERKENDVIQAEEERQKQAPSRIQAELTYDRQMNDLLMQAEFRQFQEVLNDLASNPRLADIHAEVMEQLLERLRKRMLQNVKSLYSDTSAVPDPVVVEAARKAEQTVQQEVEEEERKAKTVEEKVENAKDVVIAKIKEYIKQIRTKLLR